MSLQFLTLSTVLAIHEDLVRTWGGNPGIRDLALLESALAMPQGGLGDVYFHQPPFEMAAAYAFHIAQNHPFVDGNKRTAMAAALVFLQINGYPVLGGEDELEAATRAVASGKMDTKGFAKIIQTAYEEQKRGR